MNYDFGIFSERENEVLEWLSGEYAAVHSGRVIAALLDGVRVAAYGARTALNRCAAIAVEDARTLTVMPYDSALLFDIESALRDQVPFMSLSVAEKSIRVIAPEVTGEQRKALEKLVKERADRAKQSVRGTREKLLSDIRKKQTDGEISEDEEFAAKKELQKRVDELNKRIEDMQERKAADIQE